MSKKTSNKPPSRAVLHIFKVGIFRVRKYRSDSTYRKIDQKKKNINRSETNITGRNLTGTSRNRICKKKKNRETCSSGRTLVETTPRFLYIPDRTTTDRNLSLNYLCM